MTHPRKEPEAVEPARSSERGQDALSTRAEISSLAADLRAFAEQVDHADERGRLLRAAAALEESVDGETDHWRTLGSEARRIVDRLVK